MFRGSPFVPTSIAATMSIYWAAQGAFPPASLSFAKKCGGRPHILKDHICLQRKDDGDLKDRLASCSSNQNCQHVHHLGSSS